MEAAGDAAGQLDGFIDRFTPALAADVRAMLDRLRRRLPGANVLVYDNYNALALGFAAGERVGDVILSLAVYPRWASLFFMRGPALPDPHGLLAGSGSTVRHVRLTGPAMLDDPRIEALIAAALALAQPPPDPAATGRLIIKSVSARQRPRRP